VVELEAAVAKRYDLLPRPLLAILAVEQIAQALELERLPVCW